MANDNANSPDVPLFGVNVGLTEIVMLLGMISSIAATLFHRDLHIAGHEQDIAAKALIILPVALGVLRTFKHWVATHNNAKVVVAQVTAAAKTAVTTIHTSGSSGTTGGPGTVTWYDPTTMTGNSSTVTVTTTPPATPPASDPVDLGAPVDPSTVPADLPAADPAPSTDIPAGLPDAPTA